MTLRGLAVRLATLFAILVASAPLVALPAHYPEPDPPRLEEGGRAPARELRLPRGGVTEWVLHRSADGVHPDANEQEMLWLMNRARQDPAAEGLWLATSAEPDIAFGRSYFGVQVGVLEDELVAFSPEPPAAFDRRLYEASLAHSLDLIDRDAQDHVGQVEKVLTSGFEHAGGRFSVFSYADSALNAHAALNIDWGPGDGTGMQPGRGHRLAIMGSYDNVGLAMVPDASGTTAVGPLVFSGAYMYADTGSADHFGRFLVGTVWQDLDANGRYGAGEGFPGVTVMPDSGPYFAVTSAGGGYAIPITSSGSYQVTFSGGGVGPEQLAATFSGDSELLDLVVPVPEAPRLVLLLSGAAVLASLRSFGRGPDSRSPRS